MLKNFRIRCVVCLVFLSILSSVLCWYFLYGRKVYYTALNVRLNEANLPYIDVVIEGMNYPMVMNLSSRFEMDIDINVLAKFSKRSSGIEKWKDFEAKDLESTSYVLPEIGLGSLVFKNPTVVGSTLQEEKGIGISSHFDTEATLPQTVGDLGRGLLKKVNLLFDISHSRVIITNDINKLKWGGYNIDSFVKVPFIITSKGIVIKVSTDLGPVDLTIDTGCSLTMLHDYLYPKDTTKKVSRLGFPVMKSEKFVMNGTNFGRQKIHFLNMAEELREIDGWLGMDFIKDHVMYIDFSKKVLYIQSP